VPNISRTIYPLQIALEDFLFDESIKIGLLTVDQLTESKTIVENDSELSLSQYLSRFDSSKEIKKAAEARLLSFLSSFSCSKNQDVHNFLTTG
jgi:hypothetical protein